MQCLPPPFPGISDPEALRASSPRIEMIRFSLALQTGSLPGGVKALSTQDEEVTDHSHTES